MKIQKHLLQNGCFYVMIRMLQKNHAYRFLTGDVQGTGGERVNRIDACAAEKI